MIPLVCVALYLLIGWRAALHAYCHVERSDRQFARDMHAKYPSWHPTQAIRDRDEQEWVDKMASYRYAAAAATFVFWPFAAAGIALKALFDASLARHHTPTGPIIDTTTTNPPNEPPTSLSRSRVRGG